MTATKKTTAKTTTKTAEKAVSGAANEAFATVENMSNAARDQFENFVASMNENTEAMRDQAEEMFAVCRDNMEAAQERFQSMNTEMMEAARAEASDAVEFVNELARAKTIGDALEIQRDYWTNLFETRIERTQEMTKATVDAARDSMEPFTKSFSTFTPAGFEKFFPFAAK